MKLKDEFITHNARGETLMVPVGGSRFAGLVKGNRTLGAILDLLKQDTDEASVPAHRAQLYTLRVPLRSARPTLRLSPLL